MRTDLRHTGLIDEEPVFSRRQYAWVFGEMKGALGVETKAQKMMMLAAFKLVEVDKICVVGCCFFSWNELCHGSISTR